jgi:hypothetical protein
MRLLALVCGALLVVACSDDRGEPSAGRVDASAATAASAGDEHPFLCVFDYDLTLSSNACPLTAGRPELHCRTTVCDTYGWHDQCLGLHAREAVAECVGRGAYIGISSHASADACWTDKVTPMLSEKQFPEWTGAVRYANPAADWQYPALNDRRRWNCPDCAYTMDGAVAKPAGIARVMRFYRMDPASPADRRRVLFWDDTPANIDDVRRAMPR